MYYLTYDGDDKTPISENLSIATDAFEAAVENGDWCPTLIDDEGVVLISFYSDGWDEAEYTTIIGPVPDKQWFEEYADYPDRIAEEHDYKFGEWRL